MNQPQWVELPAKHTSLRKSSVRLIVLHDTCGGGGHGDTLYLAGKQGDGREVSVDFTVERDGGIWKLNPDIGTLCCWHAGRNTRWKELTDGQINHASVGIEIVQSAKHPDYPAAQVQAVATLCAWLCEHFALSRDDITTHAKIITDGSRDDPRSFPFGYFWEAYDRARGAQPAPARDAAYVPPPGPAARLGKIADAARVAPQIPATLKGLEFLAQIPGALYLQSKLDLDTDGAEEDDVEYESTHQDSTSLGDDIDSNEVPYFVLPGGGFALAHGIRLGDIAAVLYRDRIEFAVFADTGPAAKIGEGSLALHRSLGFERVTPAGHILDVGIDGGVVTVVFPGSGDGTAQTPERIREIGRARFAALGGVLA